MGKLKKMIAAVLAATMVLAMAVTVFAAVGNGNYSVDATLYKDEECTELSMGDDALVSTAVSVSDGKATLTFTTKDIEVTRLGITVTGHLKSMVMYDADGNEYEATSSSNGYVYQVKDFPADQLAEGAVFSATFEATVVIISVDMSGYLKFTNFTSTAGN